MPKEIVGKAEIASDSKLFLIKNFRITNKRAGEAKRRGPEGNEDYLQFCAQLRSLQVQAEELGFKIWVTSSGKTGHTYGKDYKATPDEWNDVTNFQPLVQEQQRPDSNIIEGEEGLISDEDTVN